MHCLTYVVMNELFSSPSFLAQKKTMQIGHLIPTLFTAVCCLRMDMQQPQSVVNGFLEQGDFEIMQLVIMQFMLKP